MEFFTLRAETFASQKIREFFAFREHTLLRMDDQSFFWQE